MLTFATITKPLKISLIMLLLITLLTGLIYPGLITLIAQIIFPRQANGSLLQKGQIVIGSKLIGQNFTSDKYFSGRPSVTPDGPYNGGYSSGSNMGPSNPNYLATVKQRIFDLQKINKTTAKVPIDLVLASGSGLDPDISVEAAFFQVPRIAKARQIEEKQIADLIQELHKGAIFNILGAKYVNVLELNLALDAMHISKEAQ